MILDRTACNLWRAGRSVRPRTPTQRRCGRRRRWLGADFERKTSVRRVAICTIDGGAPMPMGETRPEFAAGKKALVAEDGMRRSQRLSLRRSDPRNADIQNTSAMPIGGCVSWGPAIGH